MTLEETVCGWVKDLPVIDWHNHLDVRQLVEDRPFDSLYRMWVKADPYKHRAMRICGVPERAITGDASDEEKMAAWKETLPKLLGNPLFVWSEMESRFLSEHPLEMLSPLRILKAFNVTYASPCMGAGDDLSPFADLKGCGIRIVPSLRINLGEKVSPERLEAFLSVGW